MPRRLSRVIGDWLVVLGWVGENERVPQSIDRGRDMGRVWQSMFRRCALAVLNKNVGPGSLTDRHLKESVAWVGLTDPSYLLLQAPYFAR